MSITFYNMGSCPYCKKAKQMFAAEIASGEMIEKSADQAPKGARGFPTFTANGKMESGLPKNKEELYSKLGVYKEKYVSAPSPPIDWGTLYIKQIPTPDNTTNYVFIPFNKAMDNSIGIILGFNPGKFVYSSKVYTTPTPFSTTVASQITNTNTIMVMSPDSVNKIDNILLKVFPCTTMQDWNDVVNYGKLPDSFLSKLLPPQPCKSDKKVYCCAGKDTKKDKFFDNKTIAMLVIIVLLVSVLVYVSMSNSNSNASMSMSSSNK